MTSQINPNNIDGNYPVPGVPNNTQGFRSNFTETKTNFQYAAQEITSLQNSSVFKAALPGTTLDNNMNDNLLYAVKLQDVSFTYLPVAATAGNITIDYAAAPFQQINPSAPVSLAFTNFPVSGTTGVVRLEFNITNVAQTLTLPAAVSLGTTGIQGYSGGVITFAATGVYQFEFLSSDAGTTITIRDLSRPLLGSTGSAVGYATGAGGTVTQATNKSTGVTLNTITGQITMNAATLSGDSTVTFTMTNSTVANTDVMILNQVGGGNIGVYSFNAVCNSGSANIAVHNMTNNNRGDAIVIRYAVIKGAIA